MCYLGIDLGTTNIKAIVADDDGKIVARGSAPVELKVTPDGGVEQDLGQIYSALCSAVRTAMAKHMSGDF